MLFSEKEERGRRFSLALRAGIPVLLLIFLVFFSTISKDEIFYISTKDAVLLAAMTFIAIYFIYFLMNLSVQETMLDEITQGFNRRSFIKKLQNYKPQSIACVKIKNLQSINENYSGTRVDSLLYTLTRKLDFVFKQHNLKNVLIGTYLNSEFLIALNENHDSVQNILETMIKENASIDGIEISYGFSVITNTNEENFEKTILQLRDIIIGQSIDSGFEKTLITQDATALSKVEEGVIDAIQKKKLHLSFRPLLNVKTETIDIYEIAVKLKSLHNQSILPKVFLPIVNRLGLGREYDFTLVQHIIDLLPLTDDTTSFTFNLSPFSLRDTHFQKKFFTYLSEKNVDASRLIIQLYERKTHHDLSGYLQTLKTFRSHGIRICIDNFGSSNASMQYIKHFKFDVVQFDREFVTRLEDETNYAMLNSLITMAKDLKVQTVAKWVDKEQQKKKLKTLGINYLQGFGISKPITEEELINRYN